MRGVDAALAAWQARPIDSHTLLLLDFDGLRVYLDVKSQLFLIGTEVDWEDGILSSGFRFHNPNAKRSCSCGESFTV